MQFCFAKLTQGINSPRSFVLRSKSEAKRRGSLKGEDMFTGLVEELGVVEKVVKGKLLHLDVRAQNVLTETVLGDSISVNGVCLTVTNLDKKCLSFDIMRQTQEKTSLNLLKVADVVNLERALSFNSRLGGHIVTGHIDGMGIIHKKIRQKEEFSLEINADNPIMRFLVSKGSIAVDGVSLTIVDVQPNYFTVSLIPHTIKTTNLAFRREKDPVNLEIDMLAKYVFRYLEDAKTGGVKINETHLKNMGYVDG